MEPKEGYPFPPLPYLAELIVAVETTENGLDILVDDICITCGEYSPGYTAYLTKFAGGCSYWHRGRFCDGCDLFPADFGAEKRRTAGRRFVCAKINTTNQLKHLETLSKEEDACRRNVFTALWPKYTLTDLSALEKRLSHRFYSMEMAELEQKSAHVELLWVRSLYPTIHEYVAKTQRSAHVYLFLTWLGFPHDIAWPVIALAFWVV